MASIPLTLYLVRQSPDPRSFAHFTSGSASTECRDGEVFILYTFEVTSLPQGITTHTTIVDSQGYADDPVGFDFSAGDPPYEAEVNTLQNQISGGILTFHTTATDGFDDTRQISYDGSGPCPTPTPTPTPTSTPTPTPTPTLTPTPTPSVTNTPTPTPQGDPSPTLSPTPDGDSLSNSGNSGPELPAAGANSLLVVATTALLFIAAGVLIALL